MLGRHWDTFWDKSELYKRDGLSLNWNGTRLLMFKIRNVAEQLLKCLLGKSQQEQPNI